MIHQKIRTFLWFDSQAVEAVNFYVSLFKDSRVTYASPTIVTFELAGVEFVALNGGPQFKFTEAISLLVDCADQAEIDDLWDKLSAGGSEGKCGWLKDKYGLSWQVIPSVLPKLMSDPERSGRVMQALMQMTKLEIQSLQDAYDGTSSF